MASRHRVRAPCLQIIKTATVPAALTKRVNIKQFHDSKISFPLTRRMARSAPRARRIFHTFYFWGKMRAFYRILKRKDPHAVTLAPGMSAVAFLRRCLGGADRQWTSSPVYREWW